MPASVMVLDDSEDLRLLLKQLIEMSLRVECLVLGSVAELTARSAEALATNVALLDINLGEGCPDGTDAFSWLRSQHYGGAVFFLTGHARAHPLVNAAERIGVRVFQKPFNTNELIKTIENALHLSEGKK